jgi:hypothetical protein
VRLSGIRIPLWVALICATAPASAQQLQYAEPVSLSLVGQAAHFEAYGRRFDLTLADNSRVLDKLPAQRKAELSTYRLVRGTLDGAPGSWVRLVQSAAGVEGAIWDGSDLYAVTRYERIAGHLTTALDAAPGQTVVYRLSDLRDALPQGYCALDASTAADAPQKTGLDEYRAIVAEAAGAFTAANDRQIEISLIGDAAFQQAEWSDPTGALLARLNIVEGIFSSQLGLLVLATDVRLMPVTDDPFTSTTGGTLLEQLSSYRNSTPAVRARGLAHLVTGKDLDGTTAGIAYVGTVCDAKFGVSLSQQAFGTTISALIMAHELGHNFGAAHDGEAGTPCAGVTGGYIMASSVSGLATFSQCSIDTMRPVIERAACVTPADYADVTFESGGTVSGEGGLALDIPFTVRSVGTQTAEGVVATATLPSIAGLTLENATASQGACSIDGLTANCVLDAIESGERVTLTLVARPSSAGNFTVQARTGADNDLVTSNNGAQVSVSVRSGVDAALQLSTGAAEVPVDATLDLYADVRSLRAQSVRNATLTVTLNQPVLSATMPGASCTANAFSVNCTIAEVSAGAVRRLTVRAKATSAGSLYAGGNVSVVGDGDFTNNAANATVWVQAERDIELTAGPASVDLGVGSVYEIPFTLRARGPLPTGDVLLVISAPSSALAVDSLDAGGGACSQTDPISWRCEIGAMAPGSMRTLRMRVHGSRAVNTDVFATAEAADDGYTANNFASVQLRIDHAVDLALTMASGGTGVEDVLIEGQVALRSQGRQGTSNATLDVTLHAAGVLRSVSIHNGAACTLLSATRARCALPPMARNSQLFVDYTAEFPEPGMYDVTFTGAAPGDTAPDNDVLSRVVLVRPYNDVAIAGAIDLPDFVVGQTRDRTFTLTTDRRSLASARFVAPSYLPSLVVEAIQAPEGDCRVNADGSICDFVNLPAYASIPIVVTYRAAEGSYRYGIAATVTTAGDVAAANDLVRGNADVQAVTDLELRAGPSAGGAQGATLDFPAITIANTGAQKAFGTHLDIVLPAQLTLVSISAADAICTGTQTVRCDFTELEANSLTTVSLSVRANATGTFRSGLRVHATNDTNGANDSRDVAVEVAATPTAAARTTGGAGGGGGGMEWLGLLFLGLMLVRKKRGRGSI